MSWIDLILCGLQTFVAVVLVSAALCGISWLERCHICGRHFCKDKLRDVVHVDEKTGHRTRFILYYCMKGEEYVLGRRIGLFRYDWILGEAGVGMFAGIEKPPNPDKLTIGKATARSTSTST